MLGDSIGAGIVYHLSKAELDTAAELRDHNGGEARDREDTGSLHAVTPHQNGDKMRILGSNHNHAICKCHLALNIDQGKYEQQNIFSLFPSPLCFLRVLGLNYLFLTILIYDVIITFPVNPHHTATQ